MCCLQRVLGGGARWAGGSLGAGTGTRGICSESAKGLRDCCNAFVTKEVACARTLQRAEPIRTSRTLESRPKPLPVMVSRVPPTSDPSRGWTAEMRAPSSTSKSEELRRSTRRACAIIIVLPASKMAEVFQCPALTMSGSLPSRRQPRFVQLLRATDASPRRVTHAIDWMPSAVCACRRTAPRSVCRPAL